MPKIKSESSESAKIGKEMINPKVNKFIIDFEAYCTISLVLVDGFAALRDEGDNIFYGPGMGTRLRRHSLDRKSVV